MFDVVVVGAGPAGLAAARRAAECGRQVAMLDDNPVPGGQIWRGGSGDTSQWKNSTVKWFAGARVFDAPASGVLAVETFERQFEIQYRSLILATGARERFLPFPGWTLPNVMGAGGLQALAKSGLPVARKRIVIAGSGPLLLAVAQYMRQHDAEVCLVAEQAPQTALLRFGMRLAAHPGKLAQAMKLRLSLLGTPYISSCWPVSAQGHQKLESVTLRHANGNMRTEACDYLACGFGLIPNTELAALLGCSVSKSGVVVDELQQTSVTGIYSAGEATGIGGLECALVEGEIAGLAAAGEGERARTLQGRRTSHRRFAIALEEAFTLREELKQLPQADTIVCRCEDVTLQRVQSCHSWREAKLHTRCGMGPCQGRVCGGSVEFLTGWQSESVRPPVMPARIGSMMR